jgi:hypothetical protein
VGREEEEEELFLSSYCVCAASVMKPIGPHARYFLFRFISALHASAEQNAYLTTTGRLSSGTVRSSARMYFSQRGDRASG